MIKSKSLEVSNFLEETLIRDTEKFEYLSELRKIVFTVYPAAEEKIMYGGIMFTMNSEDFCGLFVRKNHVSLEFSNGAIMNDPDKILEGTGKFRRHIKFRNGEDIKLKKAENFIKQAL